MKKEKRDVYLSSLRTLINRSIRNACLIICIYLLTGCNEKTSLYKQDSGLDNTEYILSPENVIEDTIQSSLKDEMGSLEQETVQVENEQPHGSFVDSNNALLNEEQQALIINYFEAYYTALSILDADVPSNLFESENNVFLKLHKQVWEYMVDVRKMQAVDLHMVDFNYLISKVELNTRFDEPTDGSINVSMTLDESFWFKAYPDVEAKEYGIVHYFTLTPTDQGWRIRVHLQRGTLYWTVFGEHFQELWMEEELNSASTENTYHFETTKNLLLEKAKLNMTLRRIKDINDEIPQVDYIYNRENALAYAKKWITSRNDVWLDYGNYGGNCQNFASQALLAGGIPMDLEGLQWKWYGSNINQNGGKSGRTSSWTGVEEFVVYAAENKGYGLVATVDAPYLEGEIGDILVLGYDEDWRHTVMISEVIKDAQGRVIDYLIVSNTSNQDNYPASAYMYTRQMLIKIHGWND